MELTSLSLSFNGKIANDTAQKVIEASRKLADMICNEDIGAKVELGYAYERADGGNDEI